MTTTVIVLVGIGIVGYVAGAVIVVAILAGGGRLTQEAYDAELFAKRHPAGAPN